MLNNMEGPKKVLTLKLKQGKYSSIEYQIISTDLSILKQNNQTQKEKSYNILKEAKYHRIEPSKKK